MLGLLHLINPSYAVQLNVVYEQPQHLPLPRRVRLLPLLYMDEGFAALPPESSALKYLFLGTPKNLTRTEGPGFTLVEMSIEKYSTIATVETTVNSPSSPTPVLPLYMSS